MLRLLTRPRWLLRHALVIGLCVAFFFLSRWQFHRGQESEGTIQNYGYSVEWLLFGACVCFGWWKMLQDDLHPEGRKKKRVSPWKLPEPRTAEQSTTAAGADVLPVVPGSALSEPVVARLGELDEDRGGFPEPLTTAEIDPDDIEVIRYNEWLAQLSKAPVDGYRPKARR